MLITSIDTANQKIIKSFMNKFFKILIRTSIKLITYIIIFENSKVGIMIKSKLCGLNLGSDSDPIDGLISTHSLSSESFGLQSIYIFSNFSSVINNMFILFF